MAGEHGLWCMTPFLEMSAKIPLVVVAPTGDGRIEPGSTDDRIADFGDIYPTLLDLAGIEIPAHVDELSLIGSQRRSHLYGELHEEERAMRMIRKDRYKLIYYATGNRIQLFDLGTDPTESKDLSTDPSHAKVLDELTGLLVAELYGFDTRFQEGGRLVGLPDIPYTRADERSLKGQRGLRFL
jgi:arylsulfatase A-like enzyme